jgi:hypothetical protein
MNGPEDTPEALFERIKRRRAGPERGATVEPGEAAVEPLATMLPLESQGGAGSPDASAADGPSPALPPATGAAGRSGDVFPRSATMRLLLRHPELALGVGLPAAGLLLRSPASRRLLGAALRLGARPEIQQAVQLTSALRHRGRRSRPDTSE